MAATLLALPALALPAIASAAYSVTWSKAASLVNPNIGHQLDSVACAPTVTSTAVTSGTTSTTGTGGTAGTSGTIVNTTTLCLAGDNIGDIFASIHPARGKSAWSRERVDIAAGGIPITAIACPAVNLCVAVDANGEVTHSVDPAGGPKYWSKPKRVDATAQAGGGFAGFAAISCPSTQLCVAVDNALAEDQIAYTTNPAGPAADWKLVSLGQSVQLDAVACASVNLCVVGGNERLFTTDPTGAASAWTAVGTLAGTSSNIASLACITAKLCLGVGYGDAGSGLAAGTSTLTAAGGTWTEAYVGADPPDPSAGLVDSVACPHTIFCVAFDGASNFYSTTTPVRGNWTGPTSLKANSQATYSSVSCSETVCVEVDNRGTAIYGAVKGSAPAKTTTKTSTSTTSTSTTSTTSTTKAT